MPPEVQTTTTTTTPADTPIIPYEELVSDVLGLLSVGASTTMALLVVYLKKKLHVIEGFVRSKASMGCQLPKEERERVNQILAQLAIIYEADRVTLGVFHNGVIGAKGAHYDRVEIAAGYSSPGVIKLPELGKDVEASTIMEDFRVMEGNERELRLDKTSAHHSCSLYMTRRDIFHLWNKILFVGNLDLGIISLHWCSPQEKIPVPPETSKGQRLANDLLSELTSIIYSAKERERILG